MFVKVIKSCRDNWYKKGQVYEIKDQFRYQGIGIQVYRPNMKKEVYPDVIADGDWEIFIPNTLEV